MQYLVYRSTALIAPDADGYRPILDVSVRNNARAGVTGYLHHEGGCFLQYIEGPGDALDALYRRLGSDSRHRDMRLLGRGPLRVRKFGDWRMGFSERSVLSLEAFLDGIERDSRDLDPSAAEAVYFLMSACQRIDLGLADVPVGAPDRPLAHSSASSACSP